MTRLDRIRAEHAALMRPAERNTTSAISMTDWAKMYRPGSQVVYQGVPHQGFQVWGNSAANGSQFESSSVVFACEAKRILVFSEARFQWQRLQNGRPGELFGTAALAPLETPWIGATTRDLLARAELDVFDAGNSYWVADGPYLLRLDPRCVKILTEAVVDAVSGARVGERLIGYAHMTSRDDITIYDPTEVAHYKPYPHPTSQFLGASWLNACLPDVDADRQMTEHKRTALRNGASLGYVATLDANVSPEAFQEFVDVFRRKHEGPENAGKTVFLGGGADVKTVGQTFENLALKATQGAGETRIAACAGMHPVVVGLSEGMQGSSLNAGNYSAAKRNTVDSTMRPLWGAFSSAFGTLIRPPSGARLWYDARDIPFLLDDQKDRADIQFRQAQSIRSLVDAGFDAESAVAAIDAEDMTLLQHSGLFSVQLQPPGSQQQPAIPSEAS